MILFFNYVFLCSSLDLSSSLSLCISLCFLLHIISTILVFPLSIIFPSLGVVLAHKCADDLDSFTRALLGIFSRKWLNSCVQKICAARRMSLLITPSSTAWIKCVGNRKGPGRFWTRNRYTYEITFNNNEFMNVPYFCWVFLCTSR